MNASKTNWLNSVPDLCLSQKEVRKDSAALFLCQEVHCEAVPKPIHGVCHSSLLLA